jgi:uncharacterized protein (DUF58 family)
LGGHSTDFRDHRGYVAGDDLRHLDWRVLARNDRLMIKRFEAEIDLCCHVLLDASASMAYQGRRAPWSKYRYASVLAASIAYLVLGQNDRVALTVYDDEVRASCAPAIQGQRERLCALLDAHVPTSGTDTEAGLARLAAPEQGRGLVVWLTDAIAPLDDVVAALDRLRQRGHDVALLWTLDPDERDLALDGPLRFTDLEPAADDSAITAEPRGLRAAYQEQVRQVELALREACLARRVAFIPCTSAESPVRPLNDLLLALQHDRPVPMAGGR